MITPPQAHMHVEVLFKAGILAMRTVGEPGVHGATTAGTHGIGVNTPHAAAVAAATVGFEGLTHRPKGMIFAMGA